MKNDIITAVQIIKSAILQSQQKALKSINQEQLALYYGIGRFVSQNSRRGFWGKGAIDSISQQLKKELPGLRGFSAPSLRKMRTFYEEWQTLDGNSFVGTNKSIENRSNLFVETNKIEEEVTSAVKTAVLEVIPDTEFHISHDFPVAAFMSISFTHHYAVVSKVKDLDQRKFYIQFAYDNKLKVSELESMIEGGLYDRRGSLPNNFAKTIPDALQAFRTMQMFKDEYLLDFINVEELFVRDKDRDERFIENEIVHNVKNFIMTFGRDFTFVGNQYELEKYGQTEFPDLLFFNRELACLVAVELKDTEFKTSYLGQLAGYLKILDDTVRKPHENQSVGIILCNSANKKFVEYVIQDYDRPMGVATYKTSANMDDALLRLLPPKDELQRLLEDSKEDTL